MPNYQLQQEVVEELGDSDRQSNLSGISQQDRDNKTILLRQAASGKDNLLTANLNKKYLLTNFPTDFVPIFEIWKMY